MKDDKMLVVFDIDGTLADITHRLHFVKTKPKNWKAFFAGIENDKPNKPVMEMYNLHRAAGHTIAFASGRNEDQRVATLNWFRKVGINPSHRMFMRNDGDYRGDDIVKREILDQIIREYGKKPDMWFDDRPRVVKAIRSRGVFVFDVYQGTVDF